MKKTDAIIVDDEQRARRVLKNLLAKNCPTINVLGESSNIISAVEQIRSLQPQVVFLDIQMPHYTGFEIVNFFDEIKFEIIFVTAFDQYALKAFELCAIDYLLKPIDRIKLIKSVEKLNTKLDRQCKLNQYQILLDSIKEQKFNKIIIPELGNRRIINLNDILAIEADGAYSKIHLSNNNILTTSKNLKYFETMLSKNEEFFRTHRAWMVNLAYINFFNKTENTLMLINNVVARVSRNRLAGFLTLFKRP